VVDAGAPYEVVTFAFQGEAAFGQVNAESSFDVEDEGGALVVGGPFGALVAHGVDSPFDFYVFAGPDAFGGVDEVAEDPASVVLSVVLGVSAVPVAAH
jgi:hypothetical protein